MLLKKFTQAGTVAAGIMLAAPAFNEVPVASEVLGAKTAEACSRGIFENGKWTLESNYRVNGPVRQALAKCYKTGQDFSEANPDVTVGIVPGCSSGPNCKIRKAFKDGSEVSVYVPGMFHHNGSSGLTAGKGQKSTDACLNKKCSLKP